jgi:hypothetical protein
VWVNALLMPTLSFTLDEPLTLALLLLHLMPAGIA